MLAPERASWLDQDTLLYGRLGSSGTELWSVGLSGGEMQQRSQSLGSVPKRFAVNVHGVRCVPGAGVAAYISDHGDGSGIGAEVDIWLVDLASQETRRLTHLGAHIRSLSWSPDGREIAFDCSRYGSYDVYVVTVSNRAVRRLTADARYDVNPIHYGDAIAFVRLSADWMDHEVLVVDPVGGVSRCVATDRDFFDYHYGDALGPPLSAPRHDRLAFRSQRSGWINYWWIPVDGGDSAEPVAAADADQSDGAFSPDGTRFAYVENHAGTLQLRLLDHGSGEVRVVAAEASGCCSAVSWSPDGKRIAYQFEDATVPRELRVVEVDTGRKRRLDGPVDAAPSVLVRPQRVRYSSADGLEIDAYLYVPDGLAGDERCAAIVWPHGGPTLQHCDVYLGDVQFAVARGYVVLLPNVRGSSGYGRSFEDLNDGDWGHGDLRDLVAGAEYLRSLPSVEGARVAIHGTSYGAYLAVAAVAWAGDAFQAAAANSPYGDWLSFYAEQELRNRLLLHRELGTPTEAESTYRRSSPLLDLSHASTPLLLTHGEGVPPHSDAAREIDDELTRLYKPVRRRVYRGEAETYYATTLEAKAEVLRDTIAFFDETLGSVPGAVGTSEGEATECQS